MDLSARRCGCDGSRCVLSIRNLVSHPGSPVPSKQEGLEMLAVLSYVANLIERCDVEQI